MESALSWVVSTCKNYPAAIILGIILLFLIGRLILKMKKLASENPTVSPTIAKTPESFIMNGKSSPQIITLSVHDAASVDLISQKLKATIGKMNAAFLNVMTIVINLDGVCTMSPIITLDAEISTGAAKQ